MWQSVGSADFSVSGRNQNYNAQLMSFFIGVKTDNFTKLERSDYLDNPLAASPP